MNSPGGTRVEPRSGAAARSRAEELVTTLYAQFEGVLLAHVLKLTGNDRQWAEDVVQETLIRAWRNAETLVSDPRMLRGWLLTVSRRIVIDDWRGRRARPVEVELTGDDVALEPDRTEQGLSRMVLADLIGKLGAEHREAICETYVRGRTVREAAVVLGIPEGTVKSRVYHAMKILRRSMEESR
ncbi:sigma-70 family RNA polymerase sigma factor [Actinosynnema pretiosum subsp. pretiosum]|uniref:RNA polymerase, sigma-24 subunit, ECF subfamily n=2 Tax=Actinosynnema TaxID=40566 RepID=C6WQ75_ACTMD|nr:RNA polymerase, sigma-24 subunit, ECF subfamily [Actinosynnema mirum DSM 43827]QUF07146.1 sigma-70 family RNA polymerase sigma factor [Actinosynnema pretiosum subsp. pretiosum]